MGQTGWYDTDRSPRAQGDLLRWADGRTGLALYDVRCDICGAASEVLAPSPLAAEQAACTACGGPVRRVFAARFTIVEHPVGPWPQPPRQPSPGGA